MPTRLIIAYVLIAAVIAAGVAVFFWFRHHSHGQVYQRTREKERQRNRVAKTAREDAE
jgi:flagellar basal body-associated protein FliL